MSGFDYADKIRKLLAVANDAAATPGEAANAAAMAASLALQHNIDMGKIHERESSPETKAFARTHKGMAVSAQHRKGLLWMASGVANLYGCSIILTTFRNPAHAADIYFVGQPHNADLCLTWLDYLANAAQRANREAPELKGLSGADRYRADRDFRESFGSAVRNRLDEKLQAMKSEGIKGESSSSTALVVSNWFETEKREVQEWMASTMKLGKATSTRSTKNRDYSAATAGYQAGKKVGLHDQLGTRSQAVGAIGRSK